MQCRPYGAKINESIFGATNSLSLRDVRGGLCDYWVECEVLFSLLTQTSFSTILQAMTPISNCNEAFSINNIPKYISFICPATDSKTLI